MIALACQSLVNEFMVLFSDLFSHRHQDFLNDTDPTLGLSSAF
jgi:hypothetical protein